MYDLSNESVTQWADLLGYSADQKLLLVVELKPKVQTATISIAKQWLQQMGQQRPELYALFITPNFMVLRCPSQHRRTGPRIIGRWHKAVIEEQLLARLGREIDYAIDAAESLDIAIDTQRVSLDKLGSDGLQRVTESWLESCLAVHAEELQKQPSQAWLVESGLHGVLHNGRIKSPASGQNTYAFAG